MIGSHVVRFRKWLAILAALAAASPLATGTAGADAVAYLINVTVRPGYSFAGADEALRYGHMLCSRIAAAVPYPYLIDDVMADFSTSDEYQASYLISQAVNELCPEQIWQLRRFVIGYRARTVP